MFFVIYLIGPLLIYVSTYLAADGKRLLQKYKQNGVQIIGKVEKRWKSHAGDNSNIWYEHAIVSYDSPDDGNKYHMKLTDVRGSINPIIVIPGYPASGYPMGGINEALTRLSKGIEDALIWSLPTRCCCSIVGCCLCVLLWLTTNILLTFKGNYCNRGLLMLIPKKF